MGLALNKKIGGDGCVVLCQDQDGYDSYYQLDDGFSGRISDLHIFGKNINLSEAQDVMDCTLKGDIVSWSHSSWGYFDNLIVEKSTSPCAPACSE